MNTFINRIVFVAAVVPAFAQEPPGLPPPPPQAAQFDGAAQTAIPTGGANQMLEGVAPEFPENAVPVNAAPGAEIPDYANRPQSTSYVPQNVQQPAANAEIQNAQYIPAQAPAETDADSRQTSEATDVENSNGAQAQDSAEKANVQKATPPPQEKLTPQQERIRNLLQKNPFGNSANASASTARNAEQSAQNQNGLELRSIYCVDGVWTFGISDSVTKTTYAIRLREPMSEKVPYTIDFYDDETNSISISNNIDAFILTLKTPDPPSGPAPKPAPLSGAAAAAPKAQPQQKNTTVRVQTLPAANRQRTAR